ncbi:MAG: hypothetical protein B6D34_05310 [Candidatus Brocadia sp. UTAMX1]|nr:MAG: hypothetical protein B6D34_05310 [Candidatus Brocadia sp. UTAMX1]
MRIIMALLLPLIVMIAEANAQSDNREAQKVASESIVTLRKLVNGQNYKALGFESLDEVSAVALGEPIRVFFIRLDQLQEYKPEADPSKLLIDANKIIYPFTIREQIRSSVVVEKVNEAWNATNFGGSHLIKILTDVRKNITDSTGLRISSFFAVQIPALNLYFVGYRTDNELMLIPIYDDLSFQFKAGRTMLAKDVFSAILPSAKEHNGLPR